MKNNNGLNATDIREIGNKLILVKQIIQLQNDLINHVPSPKTLKKEQVIIQFVELYSATDNIFNLNQDLNAILEKAGTDLYEIAEMLEEQNT